MNSDTLAGADAGRLASEALLKRIAQLPAAGPTGDQGFGATLTHDSACSGKADPQKVDEQTSSRAA